ncbi:class I SAM-dependent methyltransferase [Methyloceanibacter sp.]|uniref:class I SAM-dependent methyltransferase n=1 Tax=Methyloceanibacter sp. TaxID=1965321 RepID=UPI003D6C8BA9
MPRWIAPSEWLPHAPFAFWLIDKARPRTIVELGTYRGVSYLTFCQAVQELGLSATCRAIDTWTGDEHTGFYGEEIFSQLKEYHDNHYSGFSKLIRSTFADGLDSFSEQSIDVLHIDGLRFYDDVLEDFDSWLPKLSKSAVVLLHNTNEDKSDFGVARLWHELGARYPSFEFRHGHGLGVLAVGNEIPLSLGPLFFATEASRDALRQVYGRLGLSVSERLELNTLRQNVAREDEKLAQLESALQARGEAFRGLQTEIEELRGAMMARPADEIAALRATVDRRDRELAADKEHIASVEGKLAEKAGEASALRTEVEAHQATRAKFDTLNARLIEENEQFYRDVESYALTQRNRDKQVSALRQEIMAYQVASEALRTEIEEAREGLASSLDRSRLLEERLSARESSLEETSLELAKSLDRSRLLEERLSARESTLGEARQELARSLNRSSTLEERVTAMESSTSWKLTKPLRSLSHSTRQLAKRAPR